jgi:hypothetical protein
MNPGGKVCQMVTFAYQKSQFGYILDGLGMKNVGIFYGRLEHLLPFGIFAAFWYVVPRKSCNPAPGCRRRAKSR